MKFTITSTVTYEIDDQLFNNLLKEINKTMEDYKQETSNNFKEMLEEEIGTPDEIKNLTIETNFQVS